MGKFNSVVRFSNAQISNFMKIRSVGAELFPSDGRTEGIRQDGHDKANGRFLQFCKRAEKLLCYF